MLRAYDLKGPVKYAVTTTLTMDGEKNFEEFVQFDRNGLIELYNEDYTVFNEDNKNPVSPYKVESIKNISTSDIEIRFSKITKYLFGLLSVVEDTLKEVHKFYFNEMLSSADFNGIRHQYSHDNKGNLIRDSYVDVFDNEIVLTYEPLEFDSNGNWIRRIATSYFEGKKTKVMQIRKIEYWPMINKKFEKKDFARSYLHNVFFKVIGFPGSEDIRYLNPESFENLISGEAKYNKKTLEKSVTFSRNVRVGIYDVTFNHVEVAFRHKMFHLVSISYIYDYDEDCPQDIEESFDKLIKELRASEPEEIKIKGDIITFKFNDIETIQLIKEKNRLTIEAISSYDRSK